MHYEYHRDRETCSGCRYCITRVSCPSPDSCVGCTACHLACPSEAIIQFEKKQSSPVTVVVDDQPVEVPGGITIKTALELLGYDYSRSRGDSDFFAPCETGGCYACAVLADGDLRPSCHTAIVEGQTIQTQLSADQVPLRIVGWYQTHSVGGVGTPWAAKAVGPGRNFYAEAACFSAGCNLRCRTCQNHDVTYDSRAKPVTPQEAAGQLLLLRERARVKRVAISGGEATLNRPWLLQFFSYLKEHAPAGTRIHLDTNATLLTSDLIDELVAAGMTDIGPDLKAVRLETFQTISGITDSQLARKYLKTSWDAVEYLLQNHYPENVFLGIGLPFNPGFYPSTDTMYSELEEWAARLVSINDRVQITVLDYRPEFRRKDISRPSIDEMKDVKSFMEGLGLRTVIAQTAAGHLAPIIPAPDLEKV